jgi:hypothetical protein
MNARDGLYTLLLMTVSRVAWACDLPTLVAIPAASNVGEESARLIVAVQRYVESIRGYTACVKAELAAGGGDAAPESLRNQLTVRNNGAVAEARAILALFGERVTRAENLYLAEFIAGDGEECIPASRLDSTVVVNEVAVLFMERGGRTHLNVLETSCENLERFGQFDILRTSGIGLAQGTRLCANEFIVPFFETSSARHRECALGRFFELSKEQTARLRELRAAARPADAESGGDDRAEGRPAPQRSER